jgi:aryl-alcohol dehydrogenase-like predicted oxidoreductase
MKRRDFIEKGTIGIAGAAALITVSENSFCLNRVDTIDKVNLGKTGLKVSRIALGTGTRGWRNESDQTRLGMSRFTDLAKYAYDRGIHFFDTADMYGSHVYMRQALKTIPRDKITLLTKVMTYDQKGWYKAEPFNKSLDRFRKETGSDYFDIFLMHCMVNGKWPEEYKKTMDDMSEAKSKGIIKTVGISCHSLDALREASEIHG